MVVWMDEPDAAWPRVIVVVLKIPLLKLGRPLRRRKCFYSTSPKAGKRISSLHL